MSEGEETTTQCVSTLVQMQLRRSIELDEELSRSIELAKEELETEQSSTSSPSPAIPSVSVPDEQRIRAVQLARAQWITCAERQCVAERVGRSQVRVLDDDSDDLSIRLVDVRFELIWRHVPLYPISAHPDVSVRIRPEHLTAPGDPNNDTITVSRLLNEMDAIIRRVLDARTTWEPIIVKLLAALNDHLSTAPIDNSAAASDAAKAASHGGKRRMFELLADDGADDLAGAADLVGKVAQVRTLKLASHYCGYYAHDAVQIKNRLYVVGGENQKSRGPYDPVLPAPPMLRVFDLVTRKWSHPEIDVGLMFYVRVARVGDKLFVFGAKIHSSLTLVGFTVRIINLKENKCVVQSLSGMPVLRGRFTATVVGTDVWIVGGRTDGSSVCALYDTRTEALRFVVLSGFDTLPAIAGHSATRVGHFIVLHGGTLDGELSNTTYCIDTERRSFGLIPLSSDSTVPRHRADHCAFAVGGVLVVVGGHSFGNSNPVSADVFDLRTQVWSTRGVFGPAPSFAGMSASVVGSTVLLLGGRAHSLYAASKGDMQYTYNTDALLLDIGAKPNVPQSTLAAYYGALRHAGGDVELRIGERTFRVHSIILYARCRSLLSIADGSASAAPLADVVDGLDVVLDYLYTDARPWFTEMAVAVENGAAAWAQQRARFSEAMRCAKLLGLDALVRDIDVAVSATNVRIDRAAKSRFIDVVNVDGTEGAASGAALVPLARALQKLFDTPELREVTCDFAFVVGDEQFRVHSTALQRFPYFRTLLTSGMQEARDARMVLPDNVDAEVFRSFLRFVYSDRLVCEPDAALELLALATQYGVDGLRLSASSLVQSSFDFSDLENVLHLFEASITYSEPVLRRLCLGVLRSDFAFAAVKEAAAQQLSAPAAAELQKQMLKSLTGDSNDVR